MNIGKKLLSLLTVFCLTLSLVPTVALAADATSVTVYGVQMVSSDGSTTYYKNGSNGNKGSLIGNSSDYNAKYEPNTHTLTLNNYQGGSIYSTGDLTILLVGINTITSSSSSNGIMIGSERARNANLVISGSGTLTLTSSSNGSTIYVSNYLTIKDGATVTSKGGTSGQAIHAGGGKIVIQDSNTAVNAVNGSSRGVIRSGVPGNYGTVEINDGAKLTASHIDGTLVINGQNGDLSNNEASAPAITKYTISGKIIDETNQPIAKASVQLAPTGTAAIPAVMTDSDGKYTIENVPAGTYTIQASKDGYTSSTSRSVTVESADVTDTNLTLSLIKYNVYVNGTQVTGINKDNVLNDSDQTVKYTPASEDGTTPQKLTLNGANIVNGSNNGIKAFSDLTITLSGSNVISGSGHAINMTNGALTIIGPGSLEASSDSGQTTVYTDGDVTIKGGAKITATNTSSGNGDVFDLGDSKHNLTITGNGTQVTAQKTEGNEVAINHVATLTVNDGATLTAQSNGTAISCDTFTRGVGYTVNVDATNYDGSGATASYQDSSRATYKYVKAEPGNTTPTPVISYGVWVGNTQITSANKDNVQPGVTYNPGTKTLTLNGANVTGAKNRAYTSTITDACGIYSTHALTINLVGSNTVNGATTSDYGNYGIFVSGKLTFTSDSNGSIIVSGGVSTNNGNAWVPGVYASGITVNNCNVTVSGGTAEGDKYPVSYAMSTAPTLVGVKATASRNRDGSDAETYSSSNNRNYKWIKIEQDATNTTIASPVIEPDSCYFTNNVTVTISCLTNGAKIYYSTDGTNFSEYRNAIPINDTTTITAYATKDDKTSATITATFTKRDASATPVTSVILDKSELDLKTNQNENLVATVTPANASDATVVWTSNDPSVATIDARGNVTTVGIGKARITATTKDGGYIAFCDVIVTEREPVQITFSDESGTVSPANTNAYGKLSTLPTPTRSGYSFDGWYTAAEGGTAVTTDTVFDEATTIYAHWTRNSSSGSHTTYYPVNTPAKSEGGSVVVSPKSASKGSAVTVTVTPESGYQVSSVQAVDKDGKKLTLTDKGDGKYSFVMPGSKVEVSASFAQVQKPEETSPYRDVSKDSYYYDAVQWASNKGITNGVSDGVFAPDWVCTRGQIVTFLWRSVGSPAPKTAEMPFADVAEDAYYAQAVLWAVENGITKGTSETTFSPDQTCTRAHAVAFLYRLAGSPAVTGSSFQDVAADAYYNAAVAWAVQQGITKGTSETTFSPNETCTRAQIVTFLYRMDQAK